MVKGRPLPRARVSVRSDYGLQVGSRKNVEPAPWSRAAAAQAPNDIVGPYEIWNDSHEIASRQKTFDGLSICAPHCFDSVASTGETDADCGGICASCDLGQACARTTDCAIGYCSDGRCTTNSCANKVADGDEGDVDCGGTCRLCAEHQRCRVDGDCASGACKIDPSNARVSGECVLDHCSDLHRDADEGGVDCGGVDCKSCALRAACATDSDCLSGYCDSEHCVASACSDRKHSRGETDVDCGGTVCEKCQDGQTCAAGSDCQSGLCDPRRLICSKAECVNGIVDQGENAVDCGRSCPGGCNGGTACDYNGECDSRECEAGVCAGSSCVDGVRTGDESDVDCGGACARKCGIDARCFRGSDCWTNICNMAARRCVLTACEDGLKSIFETGVDCGGVCAACPIDQGCGVDADCVSGACSPLTNTCVATTCTDGEQNRGESDVDCGGPCKPCGIEQTCAQNADCASNICNAIYHRCAATTCDNGLLDAGEADVDCGVACLLACGSGQHCTVPGDCVTGECNGTTCM